MTSIPQPPAPSRQAAVLTRPVQLRVGRAMLEADLGLPSKPHGLVLLVHDAGSDRRAATLTAVAAEVRRGGFATLAVDLLSRVEQSPPATGDRAAADPTAAARRSAERIAGVIDWAWREPLLRGLPIGLFGVGVGGAGALLAAGDRADVVTAVVCLCARTEPLAAEALKRVRAATLLAVAGDDRASLDANAAAVELVAGPRDLHIVEHASAAFAEPGAMESVAQRARQWFLKHVARPR